MLLLSLLARAFLERFLLKSVAVVVAAVGGGNDVKIERVVVVEIVFEIVVGIIDTGSNVRPGSNVLPGG